MTYDPAANSAGSYDDAVAEMRWRKQCELVPAKAVHHFGAHTFFNGDMLEVLPSLPENSIDSCVTDPPYHLQSIVKRFAKTGRTDSTWSRSGPHQRTARGFMNKEWDGGDIAMRPETWAEVFRVLKPGAHLISLCGTRTEHRVVCAIEDAGFEIRDRVLWLYGSGFPKSHNQHDDWEGWGTALKPAVELGALARKPLIGTVAENLQRYGTGALNISACRVGIEERVAAYTSFGPCHGNQLGAAGTQEARRGTQSDPKTYVGRWPANVLHDGSAEVTETFPSAPGQQGDLKGHRKERQSPNGVFGKMAPARDAEARGAEARGDEGSAARFFYSAKATKADRLESKHPTVKPVDLIAYLCRLVTPPGGTVLDPFAGSGTTAMACIREGFRSILIEREEEYFTDIKRRVAHVSGADCPLFAEAQEDPEQLWALDL